MYIDTDELLIHIYLYIYIYIYISVYFFPPPLRDPFQTKSEKGFTPLPGTLSRQSLKGFPPFPLAPPLLGYFPWAGQGFKVYATWFQGACH